MSELGGDDDNDFSILMNAVLAENNSEEKYETSVSLRNSHQTKNYRNISYERK